MDNKYTYMCQYEEESDAKHRGQQKCGEPDVSHDLRCKFVSRMCKSVPRCAFFGDELNFTCAVSYKENATHDVMCYHGS